MWHVARQFCSSAALLSAQYNITMCSRCSKMFKAKSTYLQGIEQQLVLKLFDSKNLLEHIIQLLFREDQLAVQGLLLHPGRPLRVLVTY